MTVGLKLVIGAQGHLLTGFGVATKVECFLRSWQEVAPNLHDRVGQPNARSALAVFITNKPFSGRFFEAEGRNGQRGRGIQHGAGLLHGLIKGNGQTQGLLTIRPDPQTMVPPGNCHVRIAITARLLTLERQVQPDGALFHAGVDRAASPPQTARTLIGDLQKITRIVVGLFHVTVDRYKDWHQAGCRHVTEWLRKPGDHCSSKRYPGRWHWPGISRRGTSCLSP